MTITKYVEVETDVEVEIDVDDVLEFISEASEVELKKIKAEIASYGDIDVYKIETFGDELKHKILFDAFNKYSLSELEERLK